MTQRSQILDFDGEHSLTFCCGELPADEGVHAAEHEPNGYFWEGIAAFLEPQFVERLELDSEAGMFSAVGSRTDLEALQSTFEPLLSGAEDIQAVVARADTEGFEFDH